MNVLFSIDTHYYEPFRATLRSLVTANARHRLNVQLVHSDLSSDQISTLMREFESETVRLSCVTFTPPLSAAEVLYGSGHVQSLSTFARIFIEDYLPADIEKILYLDSDILVRGDLSELWNQNLDGFPIAAARDALLEARYHSFAALDEASAEPYRPCFNAGVLLIDVPAFKRLQVKNKCMELIRKYGKKFRAYDQDALNLAVGSRWKEFSWRWNYLVSLDYVGSSRAHAAVCSPSEYSEPAVVHFVCADKPWQPRYLGRYKDEYMKFYTTTGHGGPHLAHRMRWDLHELTTRLYYIFMNWRRTGFDGDYPWRSVLRLCSKPWVPILMPFYGAFQTYKKYVRV